MKKIYRICTKYLNFFFAKFVAFFLNKINYKITPNLSAIEKFDYDYSISSRRLVFKKPKNKFGKVLIDTSLYSSNMCELGKLHETNKSPYNLNGHRSGFTGVYFLLFSTLRDKDICFAEIGIEKNASTKMWRDFFSKAEIHCFEFDEEKIIRAKSDNLENTFYHNIDVRDDKNIHNAFDKVNKKFDIIIDDSTHFFDDQLRIIKSCKRFLKKNGILIIEDIHRNRSEYSEKNYYDNLNNISNEFFDILFIETPHINNFTANWKNEKLLLLIRK